MDRNGLWGDNMIKTFEEIFEDRTKYGTKIKANEYQNSGSYLIIDQGQNEVAGYTDMEEGLFKDVPAIIFGDHTRVVKYVEEPFFIGADGVKILKSKINDANYRYLYYALKNAKIPDTGYNRHFKWLKEVTIHYPDLTRQQKIVDVLDKVGGIVGKKKLLLKKIDELIKSRFIEMFGDPVINPMGWSTKQLQDLVTDDCTISYGIVQTGDDQEEGIPVFRPVDIVNRIPVLAELKKTTKDISDKYKRTILKGRELLITVRASIADTCIIGDEFAGCNVGRGIVPIRTREDEMILEFLKYQIDSKHLNDNIKTLAKGITLMQLNMQDLREVVLTVPPVEQQKIFVAFVQKTDKLKLVVQKSLDKLQLLYDSLMQNYFG